MTDATVKCSLTSIVGLYLPSRIIYDWHALHGSQAKRSRPRTRRRDSIGTCHYFDVNMTNISKPTSTTSPLRATAGNILARFLCEELKKIFFF